jgi:hypothetical protein
MTWKQKLRDWVTLNAIMHGVNEETHYRDDLLQRKQEILAEDGRHLLSQYQNGLVDLDEKVELERLLYQAIKMIDDKDEIVQMTISLSETYVEEYRSQKNYDVSDKFRKILLALKKLEQKELP